MAAGARRKSIAKAKRFPGRGDGGTDCRNGSGCCKASPWARGWRVSSEGVRSELSGISVGPWMAAVFPLGITPGDRHFPVAWMAAALILPSVGRFPAGGDGGVDLPESGPFSSVRGRRVSSLPLLSGLRGIIPGAGMARSRH